MKRLILIINCLRDYIVVFSIYIWHGINPFARNEKTFPIMARVLSQKEKDFIISVIRDGCNKDYVRRKLNEK